MSEYHIACGTTPEYYRFRQAKNISPMPWIGSYIAAASAICFLAMAADTFYGVCKKKLWFPCRFFSLNAASLTLLAVAAKLSVDLNASLWGIQDKIAKLSSIALVATALGNFLTSLGSMDNQAILANVTALGIFIITVLLNIWIHLRTDVADYELEAEYILGTVIVFVLFLSVVSSCVSVPATKEYIEAKYQEKHQLALNEEAEERGKLSIKNLKFVVKRHWVMAATGNPQFVLARSPTCATSGSICLLSALTLLEAEIRMNNVYKGAFQFATDYRWSTILILVTQSLGVAVGVIPPTLRWFIAVSFKFSEGSSKSYKNELIIETYWTQRLEEWRGSSLPIQIRSIKCRKLVHSTKYLILSLCIKVQILIVVASKLLLLFHVFSLSPFLLFLNHVRRFNLKHKSESCSPTNQSGQESEPGKELDLNQYVILLEGEARLPEKTLRNIFFEVDQVILEGEKKQPKNLFELLQGACSFNCVADFDNDQIPSLHSQELSNCWTLPIVTLTSIALALPNTENRLADHLQRSVSEGLPYANLMQKCQDTSRTLEHIQNAADILWVGVELYSNWLDQELSNLDGSTSKEVLQGLAKTAERIVMEYKMEKNGQMKNPIHWPVKVIAADSMYRISKTILLNFEGDNEITDEQLFEKLSATIADIFASCFTNLHRVITLKCRCEAIEERESSVRQAAVLLGETQNILEIVQQRQLSGMVPDQVACIDDWRVAVKQRNARASVSASSPEVAIS